MDLRLPPTLQLFDGRVRTVVFNRHKHEETRGGKAGGGIEEGKSLFYYQLASGGNLVQQVLMALHELRIQSVLVEGGARLLQTFIREGYWDEARVITNEDLVIGNGLSAPITENGVNTGKEKIFSDTIRYYHNPASQ
jgi:diaminohydroxyphosphoribosylaminopyrimidine deaminase/5-amino-6-(5-phosphoribosylamino)uracil reductase